MERIVGEKYRLHRKIGAGSFGQIYSGEDTTTREKVAIKLEPIQTKLPQLSYESKLYMLFSGGICIPKLHWFGVANESNVMVMGLMGKSLEDLFVQVGRPFSLKTVLMLADQMISCVEYIHNKNFIHRDVKPDNFCMGLGRKGNQVHVIDFGLSKKFRDTTTHTHIQYADGKSLTGTARYASINSLRGIEQSRRDDMESLGYVWLYLLRGTLPWMGLDGKDRKTKYDKICCVKAKTSLDELCASFPQEFVDYLNEVKSLKFAEAPRYYAYKKMFRALFVRLGYEYDYKYDWLLPQRISKSVRLVKPPLEMEKKQQVVRKKEKSEQLAEIQEPMRFAHILTNDSGSESKPKKKSSIVTMQPAEAPKARKSPLKSVRRYSTTLTTTVSSPRATGQLPKWMVEKPSSLRPRK